MISFLKKLIPQKFINLFWHLPQAFLANLINLFPSRGLTVVGISGTDGKTTTTNMIYRILNEAGFKASVISTLGAVISGKNFETGEHVTSPSSFMIQKMMKLAKESGDEYFVLEVTSHGLDQFRFFGVKFDIGVITNVTHEHLDYHKTFKNYLNAKAKLVQNAKVAILNRNDENFEYLSKKAKGKVISFGLNKNSDFNPYKFPLKLKIPGEFNVLNALAASAACVALKVKSEIIKKTLSDFSDLNGRMQFIENNLGIKIVIDFAHTPNGLENALKAIKTNGQGIIALIGAEGYRDKGKRAMMGEIAGKLADFVIITSVDPRGLIDEINKAIKTGAEKAGKKLGEDLFIENDRAKAIDFAINTLAKRGDCVGIFGKGHESSMNLDGRREVDWSDFKAVEGALSKK